MLRSHLCPWAQVRRCSRRRLASHGRALWRACCGRCIQQVFITQHADSGTAPLQPSGAERYSMCAAIAVTAVLALRWPTAIVSARRDMALLVKSSAPVATLLRHGDEPLKLAATAAAPVQYQSGGGRSHRCVLRLRPAISSKTWRVLKMRRTMSASGFWRGLLVLHASGVAWGEETVHQKHFRSSRPVGCI